MALAPPFVTAAYAQAVDQPVTIVAAAGTPITDMTDGEVRKIDKDSQKVTLKHGEIKNLGMPGMTMVFKVKEASVLDAIQVGSKVRFAADKMDGALIVTAIEAVR
ncbi:MAG: copper-binding protein [Burkholderiales bacterium]|nr:MAG: copper-binding protein [Burkholderiales bacterium]